MVHARFEKYSGWFPGPCFWREKRVVGADDIWTLMQPARDGDMAVMDGDNDKMADLRDNLGGGGV